MSLALTISRLFAPTVLGTSTGTLFTTPSTPSSTVLINGRVRFTNTSSSTVAVTAYAVPSGGAAAAGNCFCNAETIAANNHADYDIPQLAAGDFLQAFAGAGTAVTATALAGTLVAQ